MIDSGQAHVQRSRKKLVECNLCRLLRHIHVFEEGPVHVMRLFLDSRAEFEEFIRNGLVGALQDVDQSATKG